MHGYGSREMWPFECLRCRHIWAEEYVVRQVTDRRGNVTEIWLSGGVPVQPPLGDARCPVCQATSVAAFPKGYLDRRPDITCRDTPDPGVAAPAGEPRHAAPAWAARRQRRHLATARAVYLTVLALAVFLIAAYEFYEIFVIHAGPH